jgi:hypothetical protein
MELFKSMAGIDITHIPYKGAPQAVQRRACRAHAHSPRLPDVLTITEAGVPGYEAITWFGMLAPAKTPKAILVHIHDAFAKVIEHLSCERCSNLRAPFRVWQSSRVRRADPSGIPVQRESHENVRREDPLSIEEAAFTGRAYRRAAVHS